jgi:drug/metabolite transporter (DMT)-like permease
MPPVRASIPVRRALTDTASDTIRGIALACLAYLIWAIGDATAKWLLASVGVALATGVRGVVGAVTVTLIAPRSGGESLWQRIRPVRWRLVMLRSVISAGVSMSWYVAWTEISLVDSYVIGFTAPLIMTVLAVPMLGERIRSRRALATLIGFGGVLIMLRPGGELWTPMAGLLLVAIVAMSVTRIMTRQLSVTEHPECQVFWLMVAHALAGLLTIGVFPPSGVPAPEAWLALIFLGISSGVAHFVYTRAFGLAPVSALAPYEYTGLLWAGIAGYLVFSEVPSWSTLAGAGVIAAAGLYNLHRERLRAADRSG